MITSLLIQTIWRLFFTTLIGFTAAETYHYPTPTSVGLLCALIFLCTTTLLDPNKETS